MPSTPKSKPATDTVNSAVAAHSPPLRTTQKQRSLRRQRQDGDGRGLRLRIRRTNHDIMTFIACGSGYANRDSDNERFSERAFDGAVNTGQIRSDETIELWQTSLPEEQGNNREFTTDFEL
jgi:hypothetical protein